MDFRPVLCLTILACLVVSPSIAQTNDPLSPASKGYELYSWPDSKGGWNFCILSGTDREKVTEEVFGEKTLLSGLAPLKRKIDKLSPGTTIFWSNRIPSGSGPRTKASERLTYPPLPIREEVMAYAKKRRIDVQVVGKTL